MTTIVCGRCKNEGQVPFTPTPGRLVLCANCHRKARKRAAEGPRIPLPPRRRLLSMRRKGHFVYDALEVLNDDAAQPADEEEGLGPDNRRAFVEMVFARGSRQGTTTAVEFIEEKKEDGTLAPAQAGALASLVEDYSRRR